MKCTGGHDLITGQQICDVCGAHQRTPACCTRGHLAIGDETICRQCGAPMDANALPRAPMPVSPAFTANRGKLIVTSTWASWLVIVGGVLFAMSALRPWVAGGGLSLRLGLFSFTGVLVVAICAVAVGLTLLMRGVSIGRIVVLWLLSTTEILATVLLQVSASRGAQDFSFFGVFLAPSSGFYFAVAGTITVIVGSLWAQVALIKRK